MAAGCQAVSQLTGVGCSCDCNYRNSRDTGRSVSVCEGLNIRMQLEKDKGGLDSTGQIANLGGHPLTIL
mgnify:CR=1 FL=1